jgi:hypothetical protein
MPRNRNAEPKPFVLIEIPPRAAKPEPATTHEKFTELTGRLELTFTVVSEYLFVGSGAALRDNGLPRAGAFFGLPAQR